MRRVIIAGFVGMAVVVMCIATVVAVGDSTIHPYDDVRVTSYNADMRKDLTNLSPAELEKLAPTFWFNSTTVWPKSSEKLVATLLERGKNPGLGVRGLHEASVTGKGVNVAIIDQPLFDDHPEFAGKIAAYKNFVTGRGSDTSMHGPSVASLLVGTHIGTAPDARLYYAAVPSWLQDADYYAKALDWIVEENAKLPAGHKIRVVSVSAMPSGPRSPYTKNNDKWDKARERAEKAGILVLDCTIDHGIIASCYYGADAEKPGDCTRGYPGQEDPGRLGRILAPTSPRTTAEEWIKGKFTYQRTGRGGLSWSIPYVAGVLAMGWQVQPNLSGDQMVELLEQSAYVKDGCKIIDPVSFIKQVKAQGASKVSG